MGVEDKYKILIVDDEPLARKRLDMLLSVREDVEHVFMGKNGEEAIDAIQNQHPDIVFLDVQMPRKSGIAVVKEISPSMMPITIFTTAYDQYTLEAFELAALDYLLKPFSDARFEESMERAIGTLKLKRAGALTEKLFALLNQDIPAPSANPGPVPAYVSRFRVELKGKVLILPVDDVDYIRASGSYAELHVGERTHIIREKMHKLENSLDPDQFCRIHRSIIVRLDRIEAFICNTGGDYGVKLKDGRHLKVGRGRRENLEKRLGLM